MSTTIRDLASVVDELRGYCARMTGPDDGALTSIQQQASRDKLARETQGAGVTFQRAYNDGNPKINFSWSPPLYVRDTGVIVDVYASGHFPIRLSLGDKVSVQFEPRSLGRLHNLERGKLNNSDFADLGKGTNYDFQGMICGCSFYGKQAQSGFFEFSVERGGGAGALGRFFGALFK